MGLRKQVRHFDISSDVNNNNINHVNTLVLDTALVEFLSNGLLVRGGGGDYSRPRDWPIIVAASSVEGTLKDS